MLLAEQVTALALFLQMIGAKGHVAEITLPHTLLTAFFATVSAVGKAGGELSTAGTFVKTVETVGDTSVVSLIEAWANVATTGGTRNDAVGTETLARSLTDVNLRAILLATWATNGTISTNERMRAIITGHSISAQVASTLALATLCTFSLAGKTDIVTTDRATLDMLGAGALATSPTGGSTAFTVGLATVGAVDDTTFSADNFLACATLLNAIITADVAVAVESNHVSFTVARMARWPLDAARVAVACDMNGRLAFAVAEGDLGLGDRRLHNGIGIEIDLDAQTVVFNLFGNLAVEV